MVKSTKKKKGMPWFAIPMMLSILSAVSIFMLFLVRYYNDWGVIFWSIVISWSVILFVILLELGRIENNRRKIMDEKNKKIIELEKALSEKK